ncbi:MAG: DUF4097 family beta strand repeat protein [Candidatus Aminicenantes bacterium]|nr:DUF4097 family beta strand repeat protein [Candidatus Aminicenantes bacterium]
MKRKEIFLIVVLIIFGLLYQLYKTGEEEIFEGCSTDSKYLLDKNHPHEFTGIKSTFENIRTLDIENLAGSIKIRPTLESKVVVKWIKIIYHKSRERAVGFQERIEIRPNVTDGHLKFDVVSQDKFPYRRARIFFDVLIPGGVQLKLINRYGDIEVESSDGKVDIDNKYGDILAKDIKAGMHIRHGYGRVTLQNMMGPVDMESRYSTVKISDAQSLEIEGRHTRMQLIGIKQDINLKNSHDSIELRDVKGNVTLNARHCRIKLLNIDAGTLVVNNTYNQVSIENLWAREADISVSHGDLNLRFFEVEDRINIRNKYSRILLDYSKTQKPRFNISLIHGKIINDTALELNVLSSKYKHLFTSQEGKPEIIINNKYGDVKLINSEIKPVE